MRRYDGPFTKSCARDGCPGVVRAQWFSAFLKRKFCSQACAKAVTLPGLQRAHRLAAAARQLPPDERAVYVRGYFAGYSAADRRWRRWREAIDRRD